MILDWSALANFGFAAVVAGFVLVRLESAMKELQNTVREQTSQLINAEIQSKDVLRGVDATMSRLADAINRAIITRPPGT